MDRGSEPEAYQLRSFFDMMRWHAPVFVAAMRDLTSLTAQFSINTTQGDGADRVIELRTEVVPVLAGLIEDLAPLPIPLALKRKAERLLKRVEEDEFLTVAAADVLLKELNNDIIDAMQTLYYLVIPESRRGLYHQSSPAFGRLVAEQFPDYSKDVAAAGRCLALDEWTACVFHLMRVLESGIHELAGWLSVTLARGSGEQWKNALDQIEKAIHQLEQQPASPEKSANLTFYSGVVAQFRWFKDAWRNHVSHARTHYDEREALEVWNHVCPFMQQLAEHKAGLS